MNEYTIYLNTNDEYSVKADLFEIKDDIVYFKRANVLVGFVKLADVLAVLKEE